MNKKAIISGSFDPITFGHLDIIHRASALFDVLYIAIGTNIEKKPLIGIDERVNHIVKCTRNLTNVVVVAFDGLLAEFAFKHNIGYIVRGVRNVNDFQYEETLHSVNKDLKKLETVLLFTDSNIRHVSSSMVKSVIKEYGDVSPYVSLIVKESLERKIWGKTIFCIVGISGTGKSFVSKRIASLYDNVECIDLDKIAHQIYDSNEPYAIALKESMGMYFGQSIYNEDGTINRRMVGAIVFNDPQALQLLNSLFHTPIRHLVYESIRKSVAKYIIFEGAVIPENGYLPLFNNNVILLHCDKNESSKRIQDRDGISEEYALSRNNAQLSTLHKKQIIENSIHIHSYGNLLELDTTHGFSDESIKEIFEKIKKIDL